MNARIFEAPTDQLERLWPLVHPFIKAAVRYHPFGSADGVLHALLRGKAALLCIFEDDQVSGCIVMEAVEYYDRTVANCWLMGGRQGSYVMNADSLDAAVDLWSTKQGCDTIALLGRPGWVRLLGSRWQQQPMILAWRPVDVSTRGRSPAVRTEQPGLH